MSFILDALKKLEREKETKDPGVVMVGPVPWGQPDRRGRARGLAVAGVVVAAALGGAFLWLRSGDGPPAAAPPPAAASEERAPDPSRDPGSPGPGRVDKGTPASPAAGALPPRPRAFREPGANPIATGTTEAPPEAAPEETADALGPEAPGGTIEPPTGTSPVPGYHLTAISSRDGQPIALLNDRLVREGDSFDGITVIRIDEASVEIEVDGQRRTIGF